MQGRTSVLIVGAGPTGLVLALWLKKKGVDFRIIDKSQGPGETSRALAVQARTLEFYRQLGIADALIDAGVMAPEIILRRKAKVVARAKIGALGEGISPFPYLLFCPQDVHEGVLCAALRKYGVEVERESELLGLQENSQGILATVKSPRGIEKISADYTCGCDGAHSMVRHEMKAAFPGGTYSQVFFVADVDAVGEMGEKGVQVSLSRQDFTIVMPVQGRGSLRLIGIVPQASETKEKIVFEDVAESVPRNTGLQVKKVHWFSSYHVHHRVAENFRKGRCFLAGDAGHIHSPAGGQGMNTGIGDAVNLAWKLADVVQGRATEKLLDSYEPERIAFARVLVRSTDTAFRFIASRSFFGAIFRAYILPTLFTTLAHFRFFLKFAFLTVSQTRIHYRASALNWGSAGEISAGDRLPWVKNEQGDNFTSLQALNWQIHIYGQAEPLFRDSVTRAGLPLQELPWNNEAEHKGLKKNMVYFIRPDGHVGFISENQNLDALKGYLRRQGLLFF